MINFADELDRLHHECRSHGKECIHKDEALKFNHDLLNDELFPTWVMSHLSGIMSGPADMTASYVYACYTFWAIGREMGRRESQISELERMAND